MTLMKVGSRAGLNTIPGDFSPSVFLWLSTPLTRTSAFLFLGCSGIHLCMGPITLLLWSFGLGRSFQAVSEALFYVCLYLQGVLLVLEVISSLLGYVGHLVFGGVMLSTACLL